MDDSVIKWPTKVDMPLNKETKPNLENFMSCVIYPPKVSLVWYISTLKFKKMLYYFWTQLFMEVMTNKKKIL